MVFNPRNCSKVLLASFPQFSVNGVLLSFVSSFKYLGHMISGTNADDADIQRSPICFSELIFYYVDSPCAQIMLKLCCSKPNAYVCMMLPCRKPIIWAHWASFTPVIILCVKIFFGYRRCDSMTNILLTLGLLSFNTVLANASISFVK